MAIVRKVIRDCQNANSLLGGCDNPCGAPSGGPYLCEYDDSIVIATWDDLATYADDFFAARQTWCYRFHNWLGNSSEIPEYCELCQTIPTDAAGTYIGKIRHCEPLSESGGFQNHILTWQDRECPSCYEELNESFNSVYLAQASIQASHSGFGEGSPKVRVVLRVSNGKTDPGWDIAFYREWSLPQTIGQLIDTPFCDLEPLDLGSVVDPNGSTFPDFPHGIDPWCADLSTLQVDLW